MFDLSLTRTEARRLGLLLRNEIVRDCGQIAFCLAQGDEGSRWMAAEIERNVRGLYSIKARLVRNQMQRGNVARDAGDYLFAVNGWELLEARYPEVADPRHRIRNSYLDYLDSLSQQEWTWLTEGGAIYTAGAGVFELFEAGSDFAEIFDGCAEWPQMIFYPADTAGVQDVKKMAVAAADTISLQVFNLWKDGLEAV